MKSKKLDKKSKKYKELDHKQTRLKAALHEDWRQFYKLKCSKKRGRKKNLPTTMAKMEKQQNEINQIRKTLDKRQITLVEDFKQTLKNLG